MRRSSNAPNRIRPKEENIDEHRYCVDTSEQEQSRSAHEQEESQVDRAEHRAEQSREQSSEQSEEQQSSEQSLNKDDDAISEECEEGESHIRMVRDPGTPTAEERAEHEVTHLPYRS